MRLLVRLSLVGLIALVAIGYWVNQSNQAALPNKDVIVATGICEDSGTTLVIDFGPSSKLPTETKCVQGFTGTSWDLLVAAGFKLTGTEKYPTGFVCRINNFPGEEDEKCIDTPGATNGSWAFFTSTNSSWEYSPFGASLHKVKCGVSEGWRFQLTGESMNTAPRVSPTSSNCD